MTVGRFLRSKRLRAALWVAAGGKCQRCGRDLPDDWHADHVTPWVVSQRTNVHEMQALCPRCNIEKGDAVLFDSFDLRTHQRQLWNACRDIRVGKATRFILAAVTPGGGKSLLPVIAASELIRPGFAEKICWVVPRRALQEQAEMAFLDGRYRRSLGHDHLVRVSVNDTDPSRNTSGYVITAQALAQDAAGVNRYEFDRRRYILVLDEVHHAWEGGDWHQAMQPLVDRAWLVILMTGSLCRHDGKKIAFLDYAALPGGERVSLEKSDRVEVIRYGRQDAIRERAIIQLHAEQLDARSEWISRDGERRSVGSFDDAGMEKGDALVTALHTDFAFALLDRAFAEWSAHKANANPRAKLLVVSPNIAEAKKHLAHLRARRVKAGIATVDDGKDALKSIRHFKEHRGGRALEALVTVAIAYEGLDVPAITHIACLTHIRSYPWIEQMLARATRYDPEAGEWASQVAHVFVPDDPDMRAIIEKIRAEQLDAVRMMADDAGRSDSGTPDRETVVPGFIVPEASALTRQRVTDLGSDEKSNYDETALIRQAMDRQGIAGVTVLQLKRFILDIGAVSLTNGATGARQDEPLLTPSQREENLRHNIQKFCTTNDRKMGWDYGETNRRVIQYFGKPRPEMTCEELSSVWAWLQKEYGEVKTA